MIKKIFILTLIVLVGNSCSNHSKMKEQFTVLKGKTMGSTYEIAYDSSIDLKEKIDYMLGFYTYLVSTYDTNSIISKFNNNKTLSNEDSLSFYQSLSIFNELDSLSSKVFNETKGAFNPAIADLINYWGFGENKKNPENIDSLKVNQLKNNNYGFKVQFLGKKAEKKNVLQKMNFNGIAAGQAVDLIAKMFDSVYHFKNYYINISGEIRAKGNNGQDSYWPIKIEKPMINALKSIPFCTVPLKNYAMATSGNYRQFFFKNGKRYGHTIDPRSGFPARNEMLSVTVLAPSAAEADAYATAFMVLGLKESVEIISKNPFLKAFIIYEKDEKSVFWASPNLSFELVKE